METTHMASSDPNYIIICILALLPYFVVSFIQDKLAYEQVVTNL